MIDFSDLPKQWVIGGDVPGPVTNGQSDSFAGLQVHTAARVPLVTLRDDQGRDRGRLIGWVIHGDVFHHANGTLTLPAGVEPEDIYVDLGGRFVMLWQAADGRILFREDASGNLPSVYAPGLRAIASTVAVLDQIAPLEPNAEAIAIFDFPARRGFLPFGLTSRKGANRLMPNHVLNLGDFVSRRVWPDAAFCRRPNLSEAEIKAMAAEAGQIVRGHMKALLTQGETVLYLSGGHDSRMVIAAAKGLAGDLRCETLDTKGGLDIHIAQKVAKIAGRPHRSIIVGPARREDVTGWLRRSGATVYDFVAEAVTTMMANAPRNNPLSGTGSELGRATNWKPEDLLPGATISLETMLARMRIPDLPVVREAGLKWMAGLPAEADATMVLDISKIEQIHGCWAGAAIYGHPMVLASIHPFSGHRLTQMILSLPPEYRIQNLLYRDYMMALSPELLSLPVNQAVGLDRLKFWKFELRQAIPPKIKRWLRPFR